MKVTTRTLWLPKRGNTEEEYEDAAAPIEAVSGEFASFKCAVADGATETSFSGLWAKLLVDGYVAGEERDVLRKRWHEAVDGKQLAWYAQEKAASGAFAALVCLQVSADESGGSWEARAIGDSCLVLVRAKAVIEKFPLTKSEEFNSSPFLLSSRVPDGGDDNEVLSEAHGQWQSGDVFYLMTDALAHWVYKRDEEKADAAVFLEAMKKLADLKEFAKVQRELLDEESRPLMRNDDVTLVRVAVV
jgi:hypothetical protein